MAQIAEAVRHMLAAGMTGEDVVAAIEAMEAAATAKSPISSGAERTRRWRERRSSQSVTVTSQASRDVTPSPPKKAPLEPPKNTPHVSETDVSANAPDEIDPSVAERDLFDRGKQLLGGNAGGMVARLKGHFGGNVALTRAAIETASTKHDPRQYVGALLSRGPPGRASNVVTLDQAGNVLDDRQSASSYPAREPNGSRPLGGQTASFIAGFNSRFE